MPYVTRKKLDALVGAANQMDHWLHVVDRPKLDHELRGVRIAQSDYRAAREAVVPDWEHPLVRPSVREYKKAVQQGLQA